MNEIHRCEYVNLLVEAEYVLWLAESVTDGAYSGELHEAIKAYKAKRLAMISKLYDTRLSA